MGKLKKGCIWGIAVYLIFTLLFWIVGAIFVDVPATYVVTAEEGTNIYSFKNKDTGKILKALPHGSEIEVEDVKSPWYIVTLDGKEAYIWEDDLSRKSTIFLEYDAPLEENSTYVWIFLGVVSVLSLMGTIIIYGGGSSVPIVIPLVISAVEWGYTLLVSNPFTLVLSTLPMPEDSWFWSFVAAILIVIIGLMQLYTIIKTNNSGLSGVARWAYLVFVWSAMLIMAGYMLFFAYIAIVMIIVVGAIVGVLAYMGKGGSKRTSSHNGSGSATMPNSGRGGSSPCGYDCVWNTGLGHGYCDHGERRVCPYNGRTDVSSCGFFKWNGKTIGGLH